LEGFLDYGLQPLSTLAPVRQPAEDGPHTPMQLRSCPHCGHIQLANAVDPALLYAVYPRVESVQADPHLSGLAARLAAGVVDRTGYCIEIGCGGGAFLQQLAQATGLRPVGVDAAANCVAAASARGIEVVQGWFGPDLAHSLRNQLGPARLVVARHVLEHVADTHEFLASLRHLCGPESIVVIETPDFAWAEAHADFTSFTEQHLSYFSRESLGVVLRRSGLQPQEWSVVPNRWSDALLVLATPVEPSASPLASPTLRRPDPTPFRVALKTLSARLTQLAGEGPIGLFGACCRAANLVNYSGLANTRSWLVVDDNSNFWTLNLGGTNLPIASPTELSIRGVRHCLICASGYEDAIQQRHSDYTQAGGNFKNLTSWLLPRTA
jgi:SAM-dependent methyltransferase